MKGVFIQQQYEIRLEVPGEKWHQGDSLPCALSIKNRGGAVRPLEGLFLSLACGNLKKIKQKEAGAFRISAQAAFDFPAEIDPQKEIEISWIFEIDKNCPISDKTQSLYLLFGICDAVETGGQLPVAVEPHSHIQVLHRVLETTYRFVLKGQKSSKGWVEAKLKPPSAPKFSTLEHLVLFSRFQNDRLELRYVFHEKKLTATSSSVGLKKFTSEVEQQLDPARYLFPGGVVNHEPLEKAVSDAIAAANLGI